MADKPWRVQWHLASNGRVIQQRSKGDRRHIFREFHPTRSLEVADLERLDARLDASARANAVFVWPVLLIACLGLGVGLVAACVGVIQGLLDIDPGYRLAGIGLVVFVASLLVGAVAGVASGRHDQRIVREAGLESREGARVSSDEASALVSDPGTQSSTVRRTKRG